MTANQQPLAIHPWGRRAHLAGVLALLLGEVIHAVPCHRVAFKHAHVLVAVRKLEDRRADLLAGADIADVRVPALQVAHLDQSEPRQVRTPASRAVTLRQEQARWWQKDGAQVVARMLGLPTDCDQRSNCGFLQCAKPLPAQQSAQGRRLVRACKVRTPAAGPDFAGGDAGIPASSSPLGLTGEFVGDAAEAGDCRPSVCATWPAGPGLGGAFLPARRPLPFHQGVLTSRAPAGGCSGAGHRSVL